MATDKTAVVIKEDTAIAAPISLGGFEEFAGAGMETVTSDDVIVPRLTIIQGLSPQLSKSKPEYIAGAKLGDIADVGMGETFPDGILFLPVMYKKVFLEWAPRASGKGLLNIHDDPAILDQCTRDDKNQPILPNGSTISTTAQWFGMNMSANGRRCFIGMASTQLKKSKKWLTLATSERLKRGDGSEYQAPLFFRTYNLTTNEESNAQGSWYAWTINRSLALPELDIGRPWQEILRDASEFYRMLVAGEVKADTTSLGGDVGETEIDDAEIAM